MPDCTLPPVTIQSGLEEIRNHAYCTPWGANALLNTKGGRSPEKLHAGAVSNPVSHQRDIRFKHLSNMGLRVFHTLLRVVACFTSVSKLFQTLFQTNHGDLLQQYLQAPGGTDSQKVLDFQMD